MSKELRIGMAIGAVLLVVLIVYLAVPNTPSQVALDTPSEETQSAPLDGEDTADEGAPVEDPSAVPGKEGAEAQTDPFSVGNEAPAAAEDTQQASAGEGTNWDKLLDTGLLDDGKPLQSVTPSLSAVNQVVQENDRETPATPVILDGTTTLGTVAEGGEFVSEPAAEPVPESATGNRAVPTPAPTSVVSARAHTIKSGENYSTIAKVVYGDARHYLAIQEANPTLDPARIKPGTVIVLPELSTARTAASVSSESTNSAEQASERQVDADAYRVQSGDSLYKIALKRYGTSTMTDDIYELNKEAIGTDSSRLKLGMVLKMPAAPAADAPAR